MSALDQAFIKAYARESQPAPPAGSRAPGIADAPSPIAAPHAKFAARELPATTTQEFTAPQFTAPAPAIETDSPSISQPMQWRIDGTHGEPSRAATTKLPATISAPATSSATPKSKTQRSPLAFLSGTSTALPLSSYAQPAPTVESFRPAFEVDRFVWPGVCESLRAAAAHEFEKLANELLRGSRQRDCKVVAVTGCRRGEGRSHLLLALAKQFASQKIKAALVDGDFQMGQMARQLGLSVRVGFDDVLAGERELADVLVESIADGLTLLPLHERLFDGVELKDKLRMTISLGILRDHYDIVLVDAGPLDKLDTPRVHCFTPGTGLDGAILVGDLRHVTPEQLALAERTLGERGIRCLGIAENFVQPSGMAS